MRTFAIDLFIETDDPWEAIDYIFDHYSGSASVGVAHDWNDDDQCTSCGVTMTSQNDGHCPVATKEWRDEQPIQKRRGYLATLMRVAVDTLKDVWRGKS